MKIKTVVAHLILSPLYLTLLFAFIVFFPVIAICWAIKTVEEVRYEK